MIFSYLDLGSSAEWNDFQSKWLIPVLLSIKEMSLSRLSGLERQSLDELAFSISLIPISK